MKKLLLLALAMGLVAGAAFASTDPAVSGSFKYKLTFDFESDGAAATTDSEVVFTFNGVVDDFTTVSVGFDKINGDSSGYDTVGDTTAPNGLDGGATNIPVTLDDFTLTQDITGALGLEAPVSLSATYGYQSFEPADYADKVGAEDYIDFGAGGGTYGAIKLEIGIMDMVTLKTLITPTEYYDGGATTFVVEADLTVLEGLSANLYFSSETEEFGLTAFYDSDMVDVSLGFDYFTGASDASMMISAAVMPMDALTISVTFAAENFIGDFTAGSNAALKVAYVITDSLDVYAKGKYAFAGGTGAFGYDFGLNAKLGSVTYNLGYSDSDMLYMAVSASF